MTARVSGQLVEHDHAQGQGCGQNPQTAVPSRPCERGLSQEPRPGFEP